MGEERDENTTVTPSASFPPCFKTKTKDEILSGDSNRKAPPDDFLCFEVTQCPAGNCILECHGMHTSDGLSLLQGPLHSS